MKSQKEIAAEAQLLEQNVRRAYASRLAQSPYALVQNGSVEVLHALPTLRVTLRHPQTQILSRLSTHRFVHAFNVHSEFQYRVHEDWIETTPSGEPVRAPDTRVTRTTRSPVEALHAAYGAYEHQRLYVALATLEKQAIGGPVTAERVKQVEDLVGAQLFASSEVMRFRADIVDFLQGHMTQRDFILQTIHRQYIRETESQRIAHHARLSMGEA